MTFAWRNSAVSSTGFDWHAYAVAAVLLLVAAVLVVGSARGNLDFRPALSHPLDP